MLVTLEIDDRNAYMFKLFKSTWNRFLVECQICFDRIHEGEGVIAVTDYATLNVEKMFHDRCLTRWRSENRRDPFNRNVRMWFNFPPRDVAETKALLQNIKGFIGDEHVDRSFADEYERIMVGDAGGGGGGDGVRKIDFDVDFESLLQ